MRTLRIYPTTFVQYHTAVLTLVVYVLSLVLLYVLTGSLYLVFQFPLRLASSTGNHRSDLFFCEVSEILHISEITTVCLPLSDLFH